MAFTYDLATAVGKVRLELGDTDPAAALFSDEEISAKLDQHAGQPLPAAADLCDILARRFARAYDIETDDQKLKRSQMSAAYATLAGTLRGRSTAGVGVIQTSRVERDADLLAHGRVARGWTDPDLPD